MYHILRLGCLCTHITESHLARICIAHLGAWISRTATEWIYIFFVGYKAKIHLWKEGERQTRDMHSYFLFFEA